MLDRAGHAHVGGLNRAPGLLPPHWITRLSDDFIMITIFMLLDKAPVLGFGCMYKQAPAFPVLRNVDPMKHLSGNEIKVPGAQPAAMQCIIRPRIEHACLLRRNHTAAVIRHVSMDDCANPCLGRWRQSGVNTPGNQTAGVANDNAPDKVVGRAR